MNKAHPVAPHAIKPEASARPRAALPRVLPHDRVRHPRTHPLPTLLAPFRGAADRAPLHSPPAPGHTPHDRTICLRSRTSHSGAPVAIASFYGKCRVGSTIESRRHDSPHAAESDRKSIPSPHRMRAIHGHAPALPEAQAAGGEHPRTERSMLPPHAAGAPQSERSSASSYTAILKGRKPATSRQT